jgi:hypothetical protein
MGVASCRGIFFCLMSCLIACSSSLVSVFVSRLDSDQWLCVLWDFDPRRDPARPGLARPGPAWPACPRRPCPPPCVHNSHSLPSLSLSSPLCPRSWGQLSPELDPRGELPFPLPPSLPPPPLSSSLCAPCCPVVRPLRAPSCAPAAPRPSPAAPARAPARAARSRARDLSVRGA